MDQKAITSQINKVEQGSLSSKSRGLSFNFDHLTDEEYERLKKLMYPNQLETLIKLKWFEGEQQ